MARVSFEKLSDRFSDLDDEFFHEAELLIIFFDFHPDVLTKWLSGLKFKPAESKVIVALSGLFNQKKAALIAKKKPSNRRGVILIENDVIESLYEPRLLRVHDESRDCALKDAKNWLMDKHKGSVILDESRINALERFLRLEGRSVDFLVFTPLKVFSYQLVLVQK